MLGGELQVLDLLGGLDNAVSGLGDLHHVHLVDHVLDCGEEGFQAGLDWQTLLLVDTLLAHLNQALGRDVLVPLVLLRLLLTHLSQILRHDLICLREPIRMLLLSFGYPLFELPKQLLKLSTLSTLRRRLPRQHLHSIRKVQVHQSKQILRLQEHLLTRLEQFRRRCKVVDHGDRQNFQNILLLQLISEPRILWQRFAQLLQSVFGLVRFVPPIRTQLRNVGNLRLFQLFKQFLQGFVY